MEELKKKFLFPESLSILLSNNQKLLLFFLAGLVLVGLGVLVFKGVGTSSTKVEVLENTIEGQIKEITVEIAGEVERPGVYKLAFGSRVEELLTVSGGLSVNANRDWVEKYLNRAAKLSDGQKIYITSQSDVLSAKVDEGIKVDQGTFGTSGSRLTNINTSSLQELDKLPGIGPVYGQNIIDHRPYSNIDELVSKGALKKNVYEKIKDMVSVY